MVLSTKTCQQGQKSDKHKTEFTFHYALHISLVKRDYSLNYSPVTFVPLCAALKQYRENIEPYRI